MKLHSSALTRLNHFTSSSPPTHATRHAAAHLVVVTCLVKQSSPFLSLGFAWLLWISVNVEGVWLLAYSCVRLTLVVGGLSFTIVFVQLLERLSVYFFGSLVFLSRLFVYAATLACVTPGAGTMSTSGKPCDTSRWHHKLPAYRP